MVGGINGDFLKLVADQLDFFIIQHTVAKNLLNNLLPTAEQILVKKIEKMSRIRTMQTLKVQSNEIFDRHFSSIEPTWATEYKISRSHRTPRGITTRLRWE